MIIWIDAQLSPVIAAFINRNFDKIDAKSVRSLGLREAKDLEIFLKAKDENVIIMSKDADFVNLSEKFGPPPQIIWITCGNTSHASMCGILKRSLERALQILPSGEPIVEISDIIN